ncbi:unnamed protein product [Cuscuta epithymum]|uniref:Uncharacterized protein n=1 Tax=Cuscuta epithymum TaxID=186058 RepID=A0AAV0C1A9_9ASTE|nr:unnamed protein product [Cuscuta epithymum]
MGIKKILSGVIRAKNLMKELQVKEPPFPSHGSEFMDLIPWLGEDCYNQNDVSISGTLFHVDIALSSSIEKPSNLNSVKDHSCSATLPDYTIINELFQATMATGVESLSHFLLKEFERIVVSCLDKRDSLDKNLTETTTHEVNLLTDVATDNQCYVGIAGDDDIFTENTLSYSGDEFLGHASESEKRTPIFAIEDLWDSDTNEDICNKASLVTRENCLPTQNLNTQMKMYRKKYQRSHPMRTRSQSQAEF